MCIFCTDIGCKHLKKGMFFAPDPYIKMAVTPGRKKRHAGADGGRLPHHGQHSKSSTQSSTTNPFWRNEVTAS